jgi:Uma2 family endonuclease
MPSTLASPATPVTETDEQRFVLGGIRWESYVAISDSLDEHSGVRLIYNDGRLTFVGKSRRHERLAESLDHLVLAIAVYLPIACEPSGEATYRRRQKEAGVEGDRTFHFGINAQRMQGMENYDFDVDPPPDLAIEVEATHSADDAIAAWGRLNVPEVWRFDAATFTCTFWNRRDDGTYEEVMRSTFLPMLQPSDVVDQMRRAIDLGTPEWFRQLEVWVRDVIRPRREGAVQ